ncbi:MAG: chemotaxis response regulator protein-glutamate methylesterase [Selenomonadaceae bacterium]|nr:chemotaxis response regulator protein-glutamate methylesterase [Selenomonadaceae bacterium]
MIRVLIADDSAFMRKVLSDLFNRQIDFQVAGTAINGKDTIDKVKKLKPDLLTLDVTMPVMDGLNALAIIMEECPLPVVMVSSTTQSGTDATVRALALGAVDFISKAGGPISKIDAIEDELLMKCRAAAKARVSKFRLSALESRPLTYRPTQPSTPSPPVTKKIEVRRRTGLVLGQKPVITRIPSKDSPPPAPPPTTFSANSGAGKKLVVIGTSTGGPQALQTVITRLPGNLPCGVVVVQHMPAGFTKSLAERLNAISEIAVKEAENEEIIKPGQVYIAPGNYHLRIAPALGAGKKIVLSQEPPVGNHRPAVNVMFDSAAQFGADLVSVIMTGMGSDGCEGMKKIKEQGGYSIAQDENSCVVYGMPKAVVEAGLADEVRPLTKIAEAIVEAVRRQIQ